MSVLINYESRFHKHSLVKNNQNENSAESYKKSQESLNVKKSENRFFS